jgi:hypothetical protein
MFVSVAESCGTLFPCDPDSSSQLSGHVLIPGCSRSFMGGEPKYTNCYKLSSVIELSDFKLVVDLPDRVKTLLNQPFSENKIAYD